MFGLTYRSDQDAFLAENAGDSRSFHGVTDQSTRTMTLDHGRKAKIGDASKLMALSDQLSMTCGAGL